MQVLHRFLSVCEDSACLKITIKITWNKKLGKIVSNFVIGFYPAITEAMGYVLICTRSACCIGLMGV